MSRTRISEQEFPDIVKYYNENGKSATYRFLADTYGMKNPGNVLKRIQRSGRYHYNSAADRYEQTDSTAEAALFMSIDELCSSAPTSARKSDTAGKTAAEARSAATEKLIHDLMGDRLLELTRYITMSSSGRTVVVDQSSMKADGYTVIVH